jgi:hypothetical protein
MTEAIINLQALLVKSYLPSVCCEAPPSLAQIMREA